MAKNGGLDLQGHLDALNYTFYLTSVGPALRSQLVELAKGFYRMNSLFCSIVIPTCNRPDYLRKCLQIVLLQLVGKPNFEILVLDDSKDDATKAVIEAEFPQVKWHQGPRRGPASNRNTGAKLAQGQWLIFLDDDCLPRSSLVAAYQQQMEAADAGAHLVFEGPTFPIGKPESLLWEAPQNLTGGHLISANFAISRALFLKIGGFDERFPFAFEDMEFEARLKASGIVPRFVEEAAVDHPLRLISNARKLASLWESRVISSYDFGAKPWQVMWHLPRHVLLVILSRFRGQRLNRDNLKALTIFAAEYWFFLQRVPFWCRRYKHSRSSFWSQPAQASSLPPRFGL